MINTRIIFFFLGVLITFIGFAMVIPYIFEASIKGLNSKNFLISLFFTLSIGISLVIAFKKKEEKINIKDTILITALSLPILVFFSSIPFYLDKNTKYFADAFFEATSGLTTTGASIYENINALSKGILIWRAMLQWIGGLGIIIFAIAIIPIFNIGGIKLFTQDWSEKPLSLHYRSKELAKILGFIYIVFTIIIFFLLYLSGLSVFDAICHAMTTVATGGFSTQNDSVGYYNSFFTEIVIVIGMLLASLPFTLYISSFRKKLNIINDSQVLAFIFIIFSFVIMITIWLHISNNIDIITALRVSLFNSVSIMTGTGFTTENFSNWGSFCTTLFLIMMLIGGCSGSTTGGIKVFRIQVLYLLIIKELKTIKSPRSISAINFKNANINEGIINSVMIMIFCFFTSIFFIATIFIYYGYDFVTSFSAAITSICVVGPGLGNIIGPSESFYQLPNNLKYVLSLGMIIGRLEFLSFLIILAPKFWTK